MIQTKKSNLYFIKTKYIYDKQSFNFVTETMGCKSNLQCTGVEFHFLTLIEQLPKS